MAENTEYLALWGRALHFRTVARAGPSVEIHAVRLATRR